MRNRLFSLFSRKYSSTSKTKEEIHPLFQHTKVDTNVFFIQEKYFISWNLANIFFIKGKERDLLIDTGVGIYSLPAFLQFSKLRQEPSKPLDVVLTHAHFDHSGGAHQFDKVFVHHKEADTVRSGHRRLTASWVTASEVIPKPSQPWDPREYRVLSSNVHSIEDGHSFDLGDRKVNIIHIPGHSPGSIALLDNSGVLVTGDTLYATDHGLIDWYPQSKCLKMKESVEKLKTICEDNKIRTILPGHNQVLTREEGILAANQYLDNFTKARCMKKMMSRARANTFLFVNQYLPLPEACRELMAD